MKIPRKIVGTNDRSLVQDMHRQLSVIMVNVCPSLGVGVKRVKEEHLKLIYWKNMVKSSVEMYVFYL